MTSSWTIRAVILATTMVEAGIAAALGFSPPDLLSEPVRLALGVTGAMLAVASKTLPGWMDAPSVAARNRFKAK